MSFIAQSSSSETDLPPLKLRGNLTADQQRRVDRIIAWIDERRVKPHNMSDAKLCRAAGVTQTLWSVLKNGKYSQAAQNETHILKMERAIATLTVANSAPVEAPTAAEYLETSTLQTVRRSVETSLKLAAQQSEHKLTILSGRTGAGKTFISGLLVKQFAGITCNALTDWKRSPRAMLEDLAAKLGISTTKAMRSAEISRAIRKSFSEPKLLVINELSRHTVNSGFIAFIREMLNETSACVVLCVVPDALAYFAQEMRDELDQSTRRGRIYHAAPITAEDVQWFMERGKQGAVPESVAEVIATAANSFGLFSLLKTLAGLPTALKTPEAAQAAVQRYHALSQVPATRDVRRKAA